jgi:hypothetical protein
MQGSPFLGRKTIDLRGTQWETDKRKSYSATVRPDESGAGYVAKILGTLVRVIQRGKDWAIQP